MAEHHLFSLVLVYGRVRALFPLGLEPSIAKPSLFGKPDAGPSSWDEREGRGSGSVCV